MSYDPDSPPSDHTVCALCDIPERVVRLEARTDALHITSGEHTNTLKEIRDILLQVRGGMRVMKWIGGLMTSGIVVAVVNYLLHSR